MQMRIELFTMFINRLLVFVSVLVGAYAATVPSVPDCSIDELRCADGRCVSIDEGCAHARPSTIAPEPVTTPEKDCTIPSHPKNGKHVVVSSSEQVEVQFTCDPGFALVGPTTARCVDGVWQGEFPRCDTDRPAVCELKKKPQFAYRCQKENGEYSFCEKHVPVGSNVKVMRRAANPAGANPVTVHISCNNDGVFNISLGCTKEIKNLENDLGDVTAYENDFNKINHTDPKFKESVENFTNFQQRVRVKLIQMQRKIEECNIYFDLLLNSIDESDQAPHEITKQTCMLPHTPDNGRYTAVALDEDSFEVDLALRFECDHGFALVGPTTVRCINGTWVDRLPTCTAACKLAKNPELVYQCPKAGTDDVCGDYVPVGYEVRVSRRNETNDAAPVTVSVPCLDNRKFNLSTDCVEEVDRLQTDFETPTIEKMTYFETEFNRLNESKTASMEFENLVSEFHTFERHVVATLRQMHQKAIECDIYLDMLLSTLTDQIEK